VAWPASVARFDLFKLATQCGLKFVELRRTQGGNTTFDISFNVWIYGTKFEPSDAGGQVELQRGKRNACATAGHCRLEFEDRGRSIRYCFI
jgi:hypothetical protein